MQDDDFKPFRDQVFTLYTQQAYTEAMALINQKADAFAPQASDLFYWRACLASCMGDKAGGLGWLQEASDGGIWYHDRILNDPDLALLRETPEFAQLQALFQERCERAQAKSRPELKTWEPIDTPRGLLMALHGASGSNLTEGDHWRRAVDFGWRVAAAQSSQVWAPGRYHWVDLDKATEELRQHLAALGEGERTALGGFSMGGGLAIRSVLSGTLPARRFFGVAPSFRLENMLPLLQTADPTVRGYIVVGQKDRFYEPIVQFAAAMKDAGLQCHVEEHSDLNHDYPPAFAASLQRGLSFLG
jgi:predicted esterase